MQLCRTQKLRSNSARFAQTSEASQAPIPESATVTITIEASWSNPDFESALCGQLSSTTMKLRVLKGSKILPSLLPDCFYTSASSIVDLELGHVIIRGDSTTTNPLKRLAAAISQSPSSVVLSDCSILDQSSNPTNIDWSGISSITSSVQKFVITRAILGTSSTIPTFPKVIPTLELSESGFGGDLPTRLFQSSATQASDVFSLVLSNNSLTGSISPTFLSGVSFSTAKTLVFALENNQISGIFPTKVFGASLSAAQFIDVSLANNAFTGPLSNIFASVTFSKLVSMSVDAQSNAFDGAVPAWVNQLPSMSNYQLNCDNCKLTSVKGSPLAVSAQAGNATIDVSLSNNQIAGALTSSFFKMPYAPNKLVLRMPNNNVSSLASNAFADSTFTTTTYVLIDLHANKLTGNVPTTAGKFGTSGIYYWISFDSNNNMAGTVPSTFLSSICSKSTTSTVSDIALVVHTTRLTGVLKLPDYSHTPSTTLTVIASDANFRLLSLPNATSGLLSLSVFNNYELTGTIPSGFFRFNSRLVTFNAYSTLLSGIMPDMGAFNPSSMTALRLSDTHIDFCNGTRSTWTARTGVDCSMYRTSAYQCTSMYPGCKTSYAEPAEPIPIYEEKAPIGDAVRSTASVALILVMLISVLL